MIGARSNKRRTECLGVNRANHAALFVGMACGALRRTNAPPGHNHFRDARPFAFRCDGSTTTTPHLDTRATNATLNACRWHLAPREECSHGRTPSKEPLEKDSDRLGSGGRLILLADGHEPVSPKADHRRDARLDRD